MDILGPNPRVQIIAETTDGFEFAHEVFIQLVLLHLSDDTDSLFFEAPIWDPIEDQVFFASANAEVDPLFCDDLTRVLIKPATFGSNRSKS